MQFLIHGAAGRMGRQILSAIEAGGGKYTVAAAVDPYFAEHPETAAYPCLASLDAFEGQADCIIDFSNHATTLPLLAYAVRRHIPVMLATTGQTEEEKQAIFDAAKEIPVFRAANMSLGIAVLCSLVRTAAAMFPDADIEIVEKHHNQKLDVPSGTALALAEAVRDVRTDAAFVIGRHENGKRKPEDIGIHSLRLGNVVGEHEIIITTGNETLTLKHEAHSRAVFADGAVLAAVFLSAQPTGLYTMADLVATCQ